MPSAPVAKVKKKNEGAIEQTYLDLWMPMLRNDKLYLEGNKLDSTTGAYFEERWHTSRIVTRISDRVVATRKGTQYVLEGGLRVRESQTDCSPIPEFIVNNFAHGFPESWQTLVTSWVAWLERQKSTTNASVSRNMGIFFNSTRLLATPSQGPQSNMTLGSVSSLTAIEGSRFLPANKTNIGGVSCIACPNCQTVLLPPHPNETPARAGEPMTTIQEEREDTEIRRRSQEEREGTRKSPRVASRNVAGQSEGRDGSRSQERDSDADKQVEHRSRSKNVKVNRNSMTFLNSTMTKTDVGKLRAANYPNTVKDQGVKNYACLFCDFKVRLFAELKDHISTMHNQDAPGGAPTPKKPNRRSQSAETVREDRQVAQKSSKGRRSLSHSEGEESVPACFKTITAGSKTEYKCTTCGGKVANKSSLKGHCKSKKHLVAAASKGVKRKSEVRISQSPCKKASKLHEESQVKSRGKNPSPMKADYKKARGAQKKNRSDTPKRTPGLHRFSCFVCDFSTDEEAAFRSHLVINWFQSRFDVTPFLAGDSQPWKESTPVC